MIQIDPDHTGKGDGKADALAAADGVEFVLQTIHHLVHQILPDHTENHSLVGLQAQQLQQLGIGGALAVGHHLKIHIKLTQDIQVKLSLMAIHHGDQEL